MQVYHIQNPYLYVRYLLQKQEIASRMGTTVAQTVWEQLLIRGTDEVEIESIKSNGFYCAFGHGDSEHVHLLHCHISAIDLYKALAFSDSLHYD